MTKTKDETVEGIWVCGIYYPITKDAEGVLGNSAGGLDWNKGIITLASDLSEFTKLATIYHEAKHSIIKEGGVAGVKSWKEGGDEATVNNLCSHELSFIKNNLKFFRLLIKYLESHQ